MNSYTFSHLSLSMQSILLWNNGQELMSRQEGNTQITLYHLHGFFAEVHKDPSKQVEKISLITDQKGLLPYLAYIDLVL